METPKNAAGEITEKIMARISSRFISDTVLGKLDTATYNKLYSNIYLVLEKEVIDMGEARKLLAELRQTGFIRNVAHKIRPRIDAILNR